MLSFNSVGGDIVLTQIKRIKGLGVFGEYNSAADLQNFGRYNVIYGDNGSGKTTLARLFSCLETGVSQDDPNLEYVIESQSGQLTQGKRYPRRVRVFNSDYVETNIGKLDGPLRHILVLGEENKALAEAIKKETEIRDTRIASIQTNNSQIAKLEQERGKLFSQIAKTIGEATSGSTLRSYRKPDAEASYSKLKNAVPLADIELDECRATVRQEQMPEVDAIPIPVIGGKSVFELARGAADSANALTLRTTQSATIARLLAHPDIAAWVETGHHLHSTHSSTTCEFCLQPLPANRLKEIADHFSVEDQKLKAEIDTDITLMLGVMESISEIRLPDKMELYSELRDEFLNARKELTSALLQLSEQLNYVITLLNDKKTKRTNSYEIEAQIDLDRALDAISSLSSIINRHNSKTKDFESEKQLSRHRIENHYLLTIKDQEELISSKISSLERENSLLNSGGADLEDPRSIESLSTSIDEKQAKVADAHAGGAKLTEHLKQFLGRTDLRFESGVDGYLVLRRGKPAKRLSEGEKTAVALLYFLVQLTDREFDLTEGVVVIDDPISSLDASAIYQAFSFLKNGTQAAKQLFLFTHNYNFLRLVINWLDNIHGNNKKTNCYLMIRCLDSENGRNSKLVPLDSLIVKHASEYHYLFKVLYTFRSDGTILNCYHIPNIARKVLETFLDFHIPSNDSLYKKLEETAFDPHKKTAIYKFANDLSHDTGKSFDPAIVAEIRKNTEYLLELIKTVEPTHYEGLRKLSEQP